MTDDTTSASAQAELPPLPDRACFEIKGAGTLYCHTADQMREYARAALAAAPAPQALTSAPTGQGAGLRAVQRFLADRAVYLADDTARELIALATRSAGDGQAVAWIYTPKDYPEIKILDKTRWTNSDWASNYIEQPLYLAPPPAASVRDAQEPDMFWNDADPEQSGDSIHEILDREWGDGILRIGDERTIQQAIRLANIKVRVIADTTDEDSFDYEEIDAERNKGGKAA